MAHILKSPLLPSEQDRSAVQVIGPDAVERHLGLPNTQVEFVEVSPEHRIVFHTAPSSPGADRIRYLRMHLRSMQQARGLKAILITSPIEEDGKTTIALNLATALTEEGKRRVLLLESDLHRAPLVPRLGLSTCTEGLVDCMEKAANPLSVMRRIDPLGWYLLPAGQVRANPADLLHTSSYPALVNAVKESFDWILIDSPPVMAVSDAVYLRQHADATLLVVRAGHTPQTAVDESVRQLGRQNIAAIVLNAVDGLEKSYYKYGSKYYRPASSSKPVSE